MFINGIIKTIAKGAAAGTAVLTLETKVWDKEAKVMQTKDVKVRYTNKDKAKMADWLLERTSSVGKQCVISANPSDRDPDLYFGAYLPVTYGVITRPATIREDVSDDEIQKAIIAIEDCTDAGELPDGIEFDFKDAASISGLIGMLASSEATIAKEATEALKALINPEESAYIGKIGNASRNGKAFRVSFVTPNSTPVEWNSVSFFNTKTVALADRAEKVLKKGDAVVLILGPKGQFKGQPSYWGKNFTKIN